MARMFQECGGIRLVCPCSSSSGRRGGRYRNIRATFAVKPFSAWTIEVHSMISYREKREKKHEARFCMGRSLRRWHASRRLVRQTCSCTGTAVRDKAGPEDQFE